MQPNDKEENRDRELVLRHHHTPSESRSLIPMWDSADPKRAPPPLPLNPGGPNSPVTRSNASATVQAAAAALAEKSQETTPSSYTVNPMPLKPTSPEKSLIKGQYHKRMQSLQNATNNNEFASYLERRSSPEKYRRNSVFDRDDRSADTTPTRGGAADTTTPNHDSPTQARISNRYLNKPILGENTPPSATMLALRDMQIPMDLAMPTETPSKPEKPTKMPESFDALSAQILSLTKIATSLQQEMSQLSRRSKDNATDLISLKAATNARDEDIRKSLKDLTANLSSKIFDPDPHTTTPRGTPYIHPATGGFMLGDSKPHESSPSSRKSFSGARMSSPGSFAAALERDLAASPGPISDGSASIALLEKVLREMATKEGQEKLLTLMEDVQARPTEKDNTMTTMLSEILNLVKENSGSRALVRSRGDMGNQLFGDKPQTPDFGQGTRSGPMGLNASPTPIRSNSDSNINAALQPSNPLADDLMAMLKRVKQSVAEGGGITSEVKALVRELRGEVLGMGRDIARKLEEAQKTRSIDDQVPSGPGKEEIEQIVTSALVDLRQQMDHIIEENARNTASTAITRPITDSQEIYAVVKRALHEIPLPQPQLPPPQEHESGLQRDEILETVREAWETYKPEIELQNFGLERDEILECLSEGLKAYQPQKEPIDPDVVYQQVLDAVHTELQSFEPPRIEPDISSIREAVVSAVQETLKGIEWPAPQVVEKEDTIKRDDVLSAVQEGLTSQETLKRDDVLSAVHEGLALQEPLKRDDVFAAVQEGLSHQDTLKRDDVVSAVQEGFAFQEPLKKDDVFGAVQEGLSSLPEPLKKEDVLSALQEVLANREPIKKDDVLNAVVEGLAAQEPIKRDDILSAVQEGLANQEVQPREIEINRDDIFDALRLSLEDASGALTSNLGEQLIEHLHGMILEMKDEFKEYSAANGRDTEQVLDATKDGLEVLRGQIESYIDRTVEANGKDEIIDTVKDGFRLLQSDVEKCIRESTERNPSDTVELLDAMEKEFEHLRQTLSSLLIRSNTTSDKDEILDAIREISDSDALKKNTSNAEDMDEILNAIRGISESESFKNSNSELADTIKQELEHLRQTISMAIVKPESSLDKDELLSAFKEHLQVAFEEHHERKDGNESIISNTNELLDAFHDGVEQLRAEMDKLHDKPIEPSVDKELLENLRDEVAGLKAGMDRLIESQKEAEEANTARGGEMMLAADASIGGDIDGLKALVTQLQTKVEAIEINPVVPERGEDPDMVKKNDLAEVLSAIKEVHGSVNEVAASSNAAREAPEKEVDPDTLKKDDLTKVLDAIKEVHGSVNEVAANNSATREAPAENVSSASKEEIEALQTLLQGMKTQLDEITPSTSATWVTAEKVEALETLAKETKETMSVFATHIDIEGPTKEDITNLEGIMKDVWVAVEEIKTAQNPEKEEPKEDPEKVVKGDVKNLETLLFELKAQIEELVLPDVNTLPTKEEITNLANTVNEFKEKMDAENELTAQAFEARKVEHGGLAEKIEEAKLFIVDFREDFKTKLTESDGTLGDMKTILECLNDSAESFAKADTIKELSELVKRESERSHGDHEASKVEATERGTALLEKIEEHRNGLKADLEAEIDKKFQEVITKYEDAQLLVDSKFTAAEERDAQSLEALTSTKAVAEDLKLVIGGMGQSLTETCDKMNDDAKTFFGRVDESFERFDHLHEDIKSFTGRVDESFGKVDNVREDMKAFTQRVDDSFGKVDNLHEDMKAFSGRVDESFGKVDNLHEDMKAFSGRVDESFGKVDNLHEDMKAFSGKVDESFGKVDNLHEDLKAFTGRADESFGKVDTLQEDLKTFSGRVDESFGKVDNLHEDVKAFSGRVDESFGKVDNLHEDVKTFFGRVDESFGKVDKMQEDVMLQNEDMKAQFDKAVAATDRIESQISQTHPELLSSIKEILAVVGQHYEHSQQSSKELKTDLCALPNSITPLLPALLPPPPEAKEPQVEKYDDTLMHEKLDTIISHASNKENSNAQMEKLNALQEQLNATAREVSEMMASHSKKTIQDYEDKKEEAMEAALALERRLAQKESVEAEVSALKEEKERLLQNIRELREEESELSRNRIKLAKEVAGMETALRIRQEEVHLMEDRAEDLERRIVEGVLNHARSQLVSRHSGSDRMSLKRVPSTASTTKGGGILGSSVGMALNRRTNKRANGSTVPNGKNERRILSLSNVSGNRGNPDRGPYSGTNNGLASLKRSHSVKTSQGYRRQSCDTRLLGSNKENESVREEEESMSEVESDAGTERRTSYTGTYADSISYITGSTVSQNRSASYSSTNVDGSVAAGSESWQEPSELSQVTNDEQSEVADRAETEEHSSSELESEESEDEEEDDEPTLHALKAKEGDMVLYHQTTDSGVGMTTD